MPEKATRRSVKKSRGGCSRCKSQHLKCDEKRPACGRCERLSLQCPGYSQPIKWSRKHELSHSSPSSSADLPGSSVQTPRATQDAFTPLQDFDWLEFTMPTHTPDPAPVADASTPVCQVTIEPPDPLPSPTQFVWPSADSLFGQLDPVPDMHVAVRRSSHPKKHSLLKSLGARIANEPPKIHQSLIPEPYQLMTYYFKTIPALYSTFDSHKNPFRSAVSDLFSHSLAVNLAAQSMAAACLVEAHPRFVAIGSRLRTEALEAVKNEPNHNYDVLLALIMSGPTGNWFQADDLGVASYHAMRDRLDALVASGVTDKSLLFFQEAMVMWELFLAYTNPSILRSSTQLPPLVQSGNSNRYEIHPWTGVARDTMYIVRDIGRLVRGNRLRSLNQKFVSQAQIHQLSADLATAQDLEARLLASVHPTEAEIAPTEDNATPIWHITTLAELYRYSGLLQLYRVFPDLLSNRLRNEHGFAHDALAEFGSLFEVSEQTRNEWLTSFALEGLRLLEAISLESGTKDFQPFVLVALASELACQDDPHTISSSNELTLFANDLSDTTVSKPFVEVALMRKFVVDRLTSLLRLIPPKPIRVCLDIVRETWRKMDEGQQGVYWLDVMIENGWETIMA